MTMRLRNVSFPLSKIAQDVGGTIVGNPDVKITCPCSLDEPVSTGIAFTRETQPRKLNAIFAETKVGAIFVPQRAKGYTPPTALSIIVVKEPQAALLKILPLFFEPITQTAGISKNADLHPTAKLGKDVSVGAFAVIGEGVVIGDGSVIHPNVVLYSGVKIGKNCTLHSGSIVREFCELGDNTILQNGAIVGADGFGYMGGGDGDGPMLTKVPQIGIVVLGPSTEVGANACVDRAALGTTNIGAHTKIDNLAQIGHNTKIGAFSIICGQVGIAGSAKIGNGVILGGQSGVSGHVTVVDGCRFGARAAVLDDVPEKGDYGGFPAIPSMRWRRQLKAVEDLPNLMRAIRKLKEPKDD